MKTTRPTTSLLLERRCLLILLLPLALSSVLLALLLLTSFNMGLLSSSLTSFNSLLLAPFRPPTTHTDAPFVESKLLHPTSHRPNPSAIPRLAYLISGSKGDLDRLCRTLRALYHPHNLYLLHLDREASDEELADLSHRVQNETIFSDVGNVFVVEKANMVTYRGPTMVANTLHACAILLRKSQNWDWFINLSASDYPLVTQDDILHTLKSLPRNLNFIEHTSRLGWKEAQRGKPLIVDPGLYRSQKSDLLMVSQKRDLPNAFKLFTGSAWMVLTRDFVEYCVWGYDNLPRTLLMYYTNFVSSPEGYFQTVICNAPEEFAATAVNHDLHYISWDVPPKQHPHMLSVNDTKRMVASNAPFARKFPRDDAVLDKIDVELLGRASGGFTPGGWCGKKCTEVRRGKEERLRPGPGSKRLKKLMDRIVRSKAFEMNRCK